MTRISTTLLWVAATASFWLVLTSSLTGMTISDCNAGIQAACEQLQKDGIRVQSMD
tara:strand:+ start:321 stop:488 length:168 start_codon:yes stop_codon:yes gene_type:complete